MSVAVVSLAVPMLVSTIVQANAENITPIETIEWPGEETKPAESTTQEDTSQIEENTGEGTHQELTSESQVEIVTDIDTSSPLAFVESLIQQNQRSIEYVSFAQGLESVNVLSHTLYKQADRYNAIQMYPPFLPYSEYFVASEGDISSTYLSLDDLLTFASDGLNQQPQIYEGSPLEDFYTFAQENITQIEGKFVEVSTEEARLAPIVSEIFVIEPFITDVLLEWLSDESVSAQFVETDLGFQLDIVGPVGDTFNQIVEAKRAEYPGIESFLEQFTEGITGTVLLNYEKNIIGLGLISEASDEVVSGAEIYIELSEKEVATFEEANVITRDELNAEIGFDILEAIQEFEGTLTADMFVNTEGGN